MAFLGDIVRERVYVVPTNVGVALIVSAVIRMREFQQLSELEELSTQAFFLDRSYWPSGEVYKATNSEDSKEGSGSHEL